MIIELKLNEGLEQLLKMVNEKEGQVIDAAKEAIDQASTETFDQFKAGLMKHKDSGAAVNSLFKHKVKIDGNEIYGLVGSFSGKDRVGYWHAAYQEYGAFARAYNVVTFKNDPWKKPVEDDMKKKFKAIFKESLKRRLGT